MKRPTIWLAAVAACNALASAHLAVAADIGFTELYASDMGELQEFPARLEASSAKASQQWSVASIRSTGSVSYKASGAATISSVAQSAPAEFQLSLNSSSDSVLWLADVVTFHVSGAGPALLPKSKSL